MEIADFIKAKRQLEDDLQVLIQERVDRFKQETGFAVESVRVDATTMAYLDRRVCSSVIDNVSVDVPIGI